jgi:hypothetical protein
MLKWIHLPPYKRAVPNQPSISHNERTGSIRSKSAGDCFFLYSQKKGKTQNRGRLQGFMGELRGEVGRIGETGIFLSLVPFFRRAFGSAITSTETATFEP